MADRSVVVVDPLLVTSNVIGDVLDMFTPSPTVDFTVHYGSIKVTNGSFIKPSTATLKPTVQLSGDSLSTNLYTLVMTDPDAPSPYDPRLKEVLHWIVVDIPEGSDVTRGKEVVSYIGPMPPIGIHRYIITLFQQKPPTEENPVEYPRYPRHHFSTREFANDINLGLPVAAMYFLSQKEPPVNMRPQFGGPSKWYSRPFGRYHRIF